MTNLELANAYRSLADLLEGNPEMAQPYHAHSQEHIFCFTKETFAATVKAFGRGAKSADEEWLEFIPEFPLPLKVTGYKRNICEKVERKVAVPEEIIPATPARPAAAERVIPAYEKTVTEYVCSPFLKSAEVEA